MRWTPSPVRVHLLEPLFLTCVCLYAANTWFAGHYTSALPFFRNHFNDLLLVPCALPPLLAILSLLGIRRECGAASGREILLCLLVWSLAFEVLGPRLFDHTTGDLYDIIAYWTGGGCAWLYWKSPRRRRALHGSATTSGGSPTYRCRSRGPGRPHHQGATEACCSPCTADERHH